MGATKSSQETHSWLSSILFMNFEQLKHPPPSPIQLIHDSRWQEKGVELFIKRDDLLAPAANDPFCGNKWRKLQYNLLQARAEGHQQLLTFGGAFSNHLAAVASAGKHLGFRTIGIVRGEEVQNPVLALARTNGMLLHFMDRSTYRQKHSAEVRQELLDRYGRSYFLPEGGTNAAAYLGCAALANEIWNQADNRPTHLAVACGTGGTMTGLIKGLAGRAQVLGVSVLKGDFMGKTVKEQLKEQKERQENWKVFEKYHHGGYARQSTALMAFIQSFYWEHGVLLEPVYTGKLFFALYDLLDQGFFPEGSRVIGIHSGGLQSFGSVL